MPPCPSCGAENKPGDKYCIQCGQPLGESDPYALLEAGIVCPSCDTYNPPDRKTCIRCGTSLHGLTGFLDAVGEAKADGKPEETVVEQRPPGVPPPPPPPKTEPEMQARPATPPPPAPAETQTPDKKPTGQMPAAVAPQPGASVCPHCGARLMEEATFCLACGQKLTVAEPAPAPASDLSIRLRLVRGYGREDSTYPVGSAGVTVGRSGALIAVPDDGYLSPVHTILRVSEGKLTVEDAGSHNGTFLRARGQAELRQGDEFVVGGQRLLLLGLGGPTTDVRTPSSTDTRPYGGPLPRQLFVALRNLHTDGEGRALAGTIFLRSGPSISIGRQGCDINYPADARMAPRHLELHLRPSGLQAVEIDASSGIYVRIRQPMVLHNGDEIMVGEEIFRVEMG